MSRLSGRSRGLRAALLGGAVLWSAGGPVGAQVEGSATPRAAAVRQGAAAHGRALIAPGEAPDLFLLYSGDVIGYLDPCG